MNMNFLCNETVADVKMLIMFITHLNNSKSLNKN